MPVESIPETPEERVERLEAENAQLRERLELASREKMGIVWRDKPEAVEELLRSALPILVETPHRHIESDQPSEGPPHVVLEGDNLHALTTLQYTHKEKVDVIYIDPPYNTGERDTFAYNDRWVTSDDPDYHSTWLSFMNRRLRLAKELLSPTGVIILAIGVEEHHRLRMLCDQVFDEKDLLADLIWEGGRKNDSYFVSAGQDYMLVYAKSEARLKELGVKWRETKEGSDRILEAGKQIWAKHAPDTEAATKALKAWFRKLPKDDPARAHKHYSRIDEKGRVFFPDNISWPGGGGPRYEVLHPVTKKPVTIPGPGWRFQEKEMASQIEKGNIYFGPDESKVPNRKSYLEELLATVPTSVFYQDRRRASQQLNAMIGKGKFQHPKDPEVLARWIDLAFTGKSGGVVLDFFAGSGSTLHAVALLNQRDGGRRQCLLVTNNEGKVNGKPTPDAGKEGIAQKVLHPRLKAILTGEWHDKKPHEALPGAVKWFTTEFVAAQQGRDDLFMSLSKAADELAAIRESTFDVVAAAENAKWSVLSTPDRSRFTLVWLDPYGEGLAEALAYIDTEATDCSVYAFNYDDTDPSWVAPLVKNGWRVEPFPTRLLAALRRHHRGVG